MILEDSYFYIDFDDENSIFSKFNDYANKTKKQVYVLKKALATNYSYMYDNACAVLIPNCSIMITNLKEEEKDFTTYFEDFIEDLGVLSDKYNYREVLGRPREWKNLIKKYGYNDIKKDVKDIIDDIQENNQDNIRKIELLTSLLIGSINDIKRIGKETPVTLLDKVKRKIVLFDGTQSNFIYKNYNDKKEIRIQGLAGTGKTELLLHKIRELYINEAEYSIVFTCYNTILEDDMHFRIPKFFNFMRVEEQIEWNKRLWIMRAWGSGKNYSCGVYSFICQKYDIPFSPFGKNTPRFDILCKEAVEALKLKQPPIEPCFDYIFIDESQDFAEPFFELCSMITRKQLFIAGDIFQNIFETNISTANTDFILSRCYRTEPKTLMLAHAIGMGLYESPPLRWLDDAEWEACGYIINKANGKYILTRNPIRRFEDIEVNYKTLTLTKYNNDNTIIDEIEACIQRIKANNQSLVPDDIAIIFLESDMFHNYHTANLLESMLYEKFGWSVNKGYETKQRQENTIFISNINNIKGLEFCFVLLISEKKITTNFRVRNAIYMALTRSLISSYFFINEKENEKFIEIYSKAIKQIEQNNAIIIQEPSQELKEIIKTNFVKRKNEKNDIQEIIEDLSAAYNLTLEQKDDVKMFSKKALPKSMNRNEITDRIEKIIQAVVK